MGIALVPEGRRLFPDLSVEENLKIGAYHKSKQRYSTNLEKVFELFPRLKDRIEQLAGSLSGGEQQMLAIGRALMAEPSLLLIDELSLGLMPKIIDQCYEVIQELKKQGMTLLIVEQNTKKAQNKHKNNAKHTHNKHNKNTTTKKHNKNIKHTKKPDPRPVDSHLKMPEIRRF